MAVAAGGRRLGPRSLCVLLHGTHDIRRRSQCRCAVNADVQSMPTCCTVTGLLRQPSSPETCHFSWQLHSRVSCRADMQRARANAWGSRSAQVLRRGARAQRRDGAASRPDRLPASCGRGGGWSSVCGAATVLYLLAMSASPPACMHVLLARGPLDVMGGGWNCDGPAGNFEATHVQPSRREQGSGCS